MKRKDKKGRILKTGEYQRKDGRYQFSVMKNKKRYTLYDKNLNSLREKEQKLFEKLYGEKVHDTYINHTVDSYVSYWFETYGMQGRKPSTIQLYKNRYACHLKKEIGSIQLNNLKRKDLQLVFNNFVKSGLKPATIEIIFYCINNILEMAVDEDLIVKNPAKGLVLPKKQNDSRKALEKEDLNNFFEFIHSDSFYSFYEPFFTVLFYTGMRIGECCALTWNDIDLKNRTIYITKNQLKINHEIYIGTPKSKASFRKIPMNDIVYKSFYDMNTAHAKDEKKSEYSLPMLDDTGKECGSISDFIFFSTKNRILTESTIRQTIYYIIKKKNKENSQVKLKSFVPHQSRHTFTSLAYEAGIDVKYTSSILGHSSIKVTLDQYTHLSEKFNEKQTEIFRRLGS